MEKQFYNFVKEVYDKHLGVEGIAIADGEKILMEHHLHRIRREISILTQRAI